MSLSSSFSIPTFFMIHLRVQAFTTAYPLPLCGCQRDWNLMKLSFLMRDAKLMLPNMTEAFSTLHAPEPCISLHFCIPKIHVLSSHYSDPHLLLYKKWAIPLYAESPVFFLSQQRQAACEFIDQLFGSADSDTKVSHFFFLHPCCFFNILLIDITALCNI